MFINQCNLCSYKVTQVADFLRNIEVQETECLLTSVICVPPCIYNKDTCSSMYIQQRYAGLSKKH